MLIDFLNNREKVASEYVARLHSGELTQSDEDALEKWLAKDPRNKEEYEKHLNVWSLSADLEDDEEFQNEDFGKLGSRQGLKRYVGVAAMLLLILSTYLIIENFIVETNQNIYVTKIGEQKTISLTDGSTVTMNTNTKLSVRMSQEERFVTLEFGEAFFDVVRDEERPFSVVAGERTVRVLGTRFNVLLDGEKTKVGVVHGLVAVHDAQKEALRSNAIDSVMGQDEAIKLEAGNLVTFQNIASTQPVREKYEDLDRLDEWRKQIITFDEKSLMEVLKELNRYSSKKILVEDRDVIDLKVSGVFPLTDIDAILEGMEHSFPVNIIRYSDRIVIVGKNSSS